MCSFVHISVCMYCGETVVVEWYARNFSQYNSFTPLSPMVTQKLADYVITHTASVCIETHTSTYKNRNTHENTQHAETVMHT